MLSAKTAKFMSLKNLYEYGMASWQPLSHKKLLIKHTVFRYCKLTIPVWVDAVYKRYFQYYYVDITIYLSAIKFTLNLNTTSKTFFK